VAIHSAFNYICRLLNSPTMKKSAVLHTMSCIALLLVILQSCSSSDSASSPNPNPNPTPNPVSFQPVATEDMVMYEINPSAFSATKDFAGISNRLDKIKALGINTIWIMPIYTVGVTNSFGSVYCVKDYTSVRTNLGTLQNLKDLVQLAHQKNMAVILDWVANHTSWDNTWITTHPEWYTHNSSGQIISPAGTNWNDVADLNFDNAAMRLAMIDAMKYWVTTADIDGFRCDAADYVPFDFWQQAITSLNAIPNKHLILLAEGSRPDHFTAGFQMNFAWDFMGALKNVFGSNQSSTAALVSSNTLEYGVVPTNKRKLRFTTNHDESNQSTPISVYGSKSAALAASTIAIYLQGVPMLYCGQEVGVSTTATYNGSNTINWNANSDMLLAYQKLLAYYNSSAVARAGFLTTYNSANIMAFQKSNGTQDVAVLVNCRATAANYSVPTEWVGTWNNALTNTSQVVSTSITLQPYEYIILER
jgi:glycosidase